MKPLLVKIHARRAPDAPRPTADDNVGRGMEMALTVLLFLGIGYGLDAWLGIFPVLTIALVLFAAIGMFVRMKYTYDATMERLEAERLAQRQARSQNATPPAHRMEELA
jgi:ABC-type protease/lipase transport system fused ATPase/permease subunit